MTVAGPCPSSIWCWPIIVVTPGEIEWYAWSMPCFWGWCGKSHYRWYRSPGRWGQRSVLPGGFQVTHPLVQERPHALRIHLLLCFSCRAPLGVQGPDIPSTHDLSSHIYSCRFVSYHVCQLFFLCLVSLCVVDFLFPISRYFWSCHIWVSRGPFHWMSGFSHCFVYYWSCLWSCPVFRYCLCLEVCSNLSSAV